MGGLVSPILANIYLHELDEFMQAEIKTFNQGKMRRHNLAYKRVAESIFSRRERVRRLDRDGEKSLERQQLITEIKELTQRMRSLPSKDPMDPNYRRLNYVRYADDFLIGVIGSKSDAEAVLQRVRVFLKEVLYLDVSEEKTGIVKATDGARFLGYDVKTKDGVRLAKFQRDGYVTKKRCPAERVILSVPTDKLQGFCNKHGYGDYTLAKGKHRGELVHSSDYEIVVIYNAELRGFATYYQLDARVRSRIGQLAWVATQSLSKTLARKHNTPRGRILKRLRQANGRYVVRHEGRNGAVLEVKVWQPKDIKITGRASPAADADKAPLGAVLARSRTDVTDRLLAGECENVLCKSPPDTPIQVHHANALANVGQSSFVEWLASARNRKTRYLCANCHPMVKSNARQRGVKYAKGEPDALKCASPVPGGGALQSAEVSQRP